MSVVLARGNHRFSGETDDYPPDVTRRTKKVHKEKKSHTKSRSVDAPLVTVAEPYPRGSLLAPLLNPIHKAIYDTSVAVSRAPGDLLYGIKPGERVDLSKSSSKSKSRALNDSDEESDSDDYSDSEEEEDSDEIKAVKRSVGGNPVAFRAVMQARKVERRALRDARRAERNALRDARKAQRGALRQAGLTGRGSHIEDIKREREKYIQGLYYGNHDAGKEKSKQARKHRDEESDGDVATGRFRLVICYWDGQREVF